MIRFLKVGSSRTHETIYYRCFRAIGDDVLDVTAHVAKKHDLPMRGSEIAFTGSQAWLVTLLARKGESVGFL